MEGPSGGDDVGRSRTTSRSKRRGRSGAKRGTASGATPEERIASLFLPASTDNPPRTYPNSRCVFRGGYVEPEFLDPIFLNIAQHAAALVMQNSGAPADDFLNLLRERSPYTRGLRIESPHLAAAAHCLELRDLDRYDELRQFKKSTRAQELQGVLTWLATDFQMLAAMDESGKLHQLARQNAAGAKGLLPPERKYPFSVEFPEQVPVVHAELLAMSRGLISVLAPKGQPGRPPEPANEDICRAWIAAGRPELGSAVLTGIAQKFYAVEWASAATASVRRTLRERARKVIERGEEAAT